MINFLKNRTILVVIIIGLLVVVAGILLEAFQNSTFSSRMKVSDVEINNIAKSPVEKNDEGDFVFEREDDFEIAYIKQDNVFFIEINSPEFDSARIKAENSFLKQLGINKEDACKLNVKLYTPSYVNEELSAFEYGLSFCNN